MRHLRKEQFFRYRQYLRMAFRHLTARKAVNLARTEWRLRRGNPDMSGIHPEMLFVDMAPGCNLRCPLCFTGRGILRSRRQLMTLDAYRQIVEPAAPWLTQVFLYNNSEPFLNPAVYDIVAWTAAQNIATMTSSNLSLPVDAERLVSSGLEYLVISADGITQDVYGQYRQGGSLRTVTENIRAIAGARKKAGTPFPFMEWQCLVTRKNEHQVPDIPAFARNLGVDTVRFANINFYPIPPAERPRLEEEWLPRDPAYRAFAAAEKPVAADIRRRPCYWLWRTAIINCDGTVLPCCLYDTQAWGNALEEPLELIWRNALYRKARLKHRQDSATGPDIVCDTCRAPFLYS